VLAFPGEGSNNFLAGINGADNFGRSKGKLVAIHLEESDLVAPGLKLIPRCVDLGGEFVAIDCEFSGVS